MPLSLSARIPDPRTPRMRRTTVRYREVLIPFAAWPLYEVFVTLEDWLDSLPPSAERPIVGRATEEEFTKRLTTFLLGPLVTAEGKLGGMKSGGARVAIIPEEYELGEDAPITRGRCGNALSRGFLARRTERCKTQNAHAGRHERRANQKKWGDGSPSPTFSTCSKPPPTDANPELLPKTDKVPQAPQPQGHPA